MKHKVLIALIGASVVIASVSGCSSKKEEGPETLEISDMEVVGESETESESGTAEEITETESDTEEQELSVDLSGELETGNAQQKAEPGENAAGKVSAFQFHNRSPIPLSSIPARLGSARFSREFCGCAPSRCCWIPS